MFTLLNSNVNTASVRNIPEQWSAINLFRHNFADISAPVHIEKSYVRWKLTSGHNYFADTVREMARSQTVMMCRPGAIEQWSPQTSPIVLHNSWRRRLLSFGANAFVFFLCHRIHNALPLSVHVDANVWASCSKNSGERFKWRFVV